jgi:hypothetical protein
MEIAAAAAAFKRYMITLPFLVSFGRMAVAFVETLL